MTNEIRNPKSESRNKFEIPRVPLGNLAKERLSANLKPMVSLVIGTWVFIRISSFVIRHSDPRRRLGFWFNRIRQCYPPEHVIQPPLFSADFLYLPAVGGFNDVSDKLAVALRSWEDARPNFSIFLFEDRGFSSVTHA